MSAQDILIFVLLGFVVAGFIYFHFIFPKKNKDEENNEK